MTMRIAREDTIGGISSMEVRDLLKKCGAGFRADWITDKGYGKRAASALIRGLLQSGYISPHPSELDETSKLPWYEITDLGRAFLRALAAKPVSRQTADRALQDFMERVKEVNNGTRFLYRVTAVVVYGSYVRGATTLGDLDLAFELQHTIEDFEERKQATRKYFEASGRPYNRTADEFYWAWQEVNLFLKNKKRTLSLHTMDDFWEMPKDDKFSYHVLLGDPAEIAARLDTAAAH